MGALRDDLKSPILDGETEAHEGKVLVRLCTAGTRAGFM